MSEGEREQVPVSSRRGGVVPAVVGCAHRPLGPWPRAALSRLFARPLSGARARAAFGMAARRVAVVACGAALSAAVACSGTATAPGPADEDAAGGVVHGAGVDPAAMTIRVGVISDLSGRFNTSALRAAHGHLAYWEWLNDAGGIRGWTVEPVLVDNAYSVAAHVDGYEMLSVGGADGVAMLSMSAGTPQNVAIAEALAEDSMVALPHSRYSGWADPGIGANLFESLTSYCVEAMNGAAHMAANHGDKVAVVRLAGLYGRDSAAGIRHASKQLGLDIVYDAEIALGDLSSGVEGNLGDVVEGLAASGADWVWLATDPSSTAVLMLHATNAGFHGQWSGGGGSWTPLLLSTPVRGIADSSYTHVAAFPAWNGNNSQGMAEMIAAMRQYRPHASFDDQYVRSWIHGYIATQILDRAITSGDLTRAGITAAARRVHIDLKGLGPNPNWHDGPDATIARSTHIYDVDLSRYTPNLQLHEFDYFSLPYDNLEIGDEPRTVQHDDAGSGYRLIKEDYISPVARDWQYQACA